jgi:hypothetical protein
LLTFSHQLASANDDIVDWDVDEFDEEANEAHNGKAYSCGNRNFLVF